MAGTGSSPLTGEAPPALVARKPQLASARAGVAAAEVAGAPEREVQIVVDQERLAALGVFDLLPDGHVVETRQAALEKANEVLMYRPGSDPESQWNST